MWARAGGLVVLLLFFQGAAAAPFVWPVSGTAAPDPLNTSFGPRINSSQWDFHDGMDLPQPIGTPVRAVHGAQVYREGPGGTDGYSSRHVVLRIDGHPEGTLYAVYLHLSSIDPAVVEGGSVLQGQVIGAAGDDDATYSHLHFEIRAGSPSEVASAHPLRFLPYTDSVNFTPPVLERIQVISGSRAARLGFTAPDKDEGDLARVEVDLRAGLSLLATRVVALDDKGTVNEGIGDRRAFRNDIALEGYQSSNMAADGRTDLHYGIVVRNIPAACDGIQARVIDVAGNVVPGPLAPLPAVGPASIHASFEDGAMPPAGWVARTSSSGTGTSVASSAPAAHAGTRGMACTDLSASEGSSQTASIELGSPLPPGRWQWVAESWIRADSLGVGGGQNVYPLYFRIGTLLSVAATIRGTGPGAVWGIVTKEPDGTTGASISTVPVPSSTWQRLTLELLRIGTRETTAVLYLDGTEIRRRSWDGAPSEPDGFRAGVGFSTATATAVLSCDDVRLSDGGRLSLPTFAPGEVPWSTDAPGQPLTLARSGGSLLLSWGLSCNLGGPDYEVYEGALGAFGVTSPVACTTAGVPSAQVPMPAGSAFYLVVPRTAEEGSYGRSSAGQERAPSGSACAPQLLGSCGT